jgi:solute carrier family 8 (sodium/calcium exchanger)
MRPKVSSHVLAKFKWMVGGFTIIALATVIVDAVDVSRWSGYDDELATKFSRGQIVEYADENNFCHSYVLIPGVPLIGKWLLIIAYFLALCYLFLGISIIADIFMGAIEVITSHTRSVEYEDDNGIPRTANISVWNPTIANLTLMALGSSAPEILLSVIETVQNLGSTPGELGASTIVGSAAFNLLVISAVCVASVPTGQTKKIQDTFVFGVTSITSIFAYIWLYIVLEVWSEGKIEIAEAVLTFLFFPIFVGVAYIADKINQHKRKKDKEQARDLKQRNIPIKEFFHILGAKSTEKAKNQHGKGQYEKVNDLNNFWKDHFGTQELTAKSLEKIREDIVPKDPIQQRIHFRRNFGRMLRVKDRQEVKKNEILFKQLKEVEQEQVKFLSPIVGFKCLHYSVSEGIGKINVKFINKTQKEMEIGIRTVDDTANAGSDYEAIDTTVSFGDGQIEQFVEVKIINDDTFEPDEDFYLELYDPETGNRLAGNDTRTKITIIDDDKPGKVGFTSRFIQVRAKDKMVKLKILRQAGTDGQISVKFKCNEIPDAKLKAEPNVDFTPVAGTVTFEQGENEKEIVIPILERPALEERGDMFEVELYEPTGGSTLGKKSKASVEICGDNEVVRKAKGLEEIINMIQKEQNLSWGQQFKNACLLSPQVDENGVIDEITGWEAVIHFCAIGWKVLFALVPPVRHWRGWPAFIISLAFIGVLTAIVGEFAALLGCVCSLKQSLTAITIVALGTSLPDTFASRQAAVQSDNADVAIGNITGSNCVNVFLGLGLPWLIGAIYYSSEDGDFIVPKEGLGFSVLMFLITSILCLITLVVRRFVFGGELGGNDPKWKWITAAWMVFLWFIYILFSGLKTYGAF